MKKLCALFCLSSLISVAAPTVGYGLTGPGPVVVITGGYDSCTRDRAGNVSPFGGNFNGEGVRFVNQMQEKFATIERGVRWVFFCFDKQGTLYVQDSSDNAVEGSDMWDVNFLIDRIERQSENYQRPVYVIGHSHGGWLAMQIALSLRQPLVGGYLATIDPISFIECNAATFADALLGGWGQLEPCRRAPQDMGSWGVNQIKKMIPGGSWRHYYQTNFLPLHSGPMHGPDKSLDMSPFLSLNAGVASTINAHVRIANLSSVWIGLRLSLERDFGLN
jgi:hypothetical protein